MNTKNHASNPIEEKITVIVSARNEEDHIEQLLSSLINQNYTNYEIIVVDDHSTDRTAELCSTQCNVIVLPAHGHGKKAAISQALEQATGQIIACTDADCIAPPNWLKEINNFFQDSTFHFGSGPVRFLSKNGVLQALQRIEFASLVGSGASCIKLQKPTMCNGANIFFRKPTFQRVKGYEGNEHIASGDDEFLMHKIAVEIPHSIGFLKSTDAIIETQSCDSWKQFVRQRTRWASKWKHYKNKTSKYLAPFIFLANLAVLLALAAALVSHNDRLILIPLLILKTSIDFLYLNEIHRFLYKRHIGILYYLILTFTYPLYVIYFGIWSGNKEYIWKDRTYNKA